MLAERVDHALGLSGCCPARTRESTVLSVVSLLITEGGGSNAPDFSVQRSALQQRSKNMKRALAFVFLVCASACSLYAQAGNTTAVDTTVCAVLANPKSFNGKIVRIQGTVVAGFDQFIIKGENCGQPVNAIWLSYPPGTKGKAGPIALLQLQAAHNFAGKLPAVTRTPVTLDRDKEFKRFDSLLAQPHKKGGGMCLGCFQNAVSATLTGRLDGVADAALQRNAAGKIVGLGGFGNMNAYPERLVLQSVTDVTAKPEDYSTSDVITRHDPKPSNNSNNNSNSPACSAVSICEASRSTGSATSNGAITSGNLASAPGPVAAVQRATAAMGSDPGALTAQRDAAVYGKPGEKNGVNVAFGTPNEVQPSEDTRSAQDSPDGVLYNCTFNMEQMKGELPEALLHVGQEIYDLRTATANEILPLNTLENNAWVVTVAVAVRDGMRSFTLPGGYLFYTAKWPAAEHESKMEAALSSFLSNEEMLSK